MERHELMRLLVGDDAASKAALAALADGADYVVWEAGTRLSDGHAGIFAMRLRRMRRKGAENLGWERAVELLRERPQPIRIGQITASDRSWIYTIFLTEDGGALVACAGVRHQVEQPPPSGAV
ncbi:hypothetical protein OHS33_12180 [Streptomyces sp. NBC_00536]|uniref:hypothetical protein n=1 Tax=Streptomyces sp. NBC_00536 TaxID=2975769 RepID=UPI002E81AA3C|nr:hypothetical protein [Streptomyces sp. NBC_00536]WUC79028.1 hypothetical protein OHS33_12180 [Streptomyces sp. NBC_00536]